MTGSDEQKQPSHVTTSTGRILRIGNGPAGVPVPPAPTVDHARRTDVLFRVRHEEGHEVSVWWMVGAFVVSSGIAVLLLSALPGG